MALHSKFLFFNCKTGMRHFLCFYIRILLYGQHKKAASSASDDACFIDSKQVCSKKGIVIKRGIVIMKRFE